MNVLETILNRRWILKGRDKELYYQVRDQLGPVKKFLTEKLGYQVIVNPYLIKVEKMPAQAKPWMGINNFSDPLEYVFLCMSLMFLEDKEAEEQFVLSELTEYIQSQYREEAVDWTKYTYRRQLIRVIKFCLDSGMIKTTDGSEEDFAKDGAGEVLYENTGVSRYFMRNFTRDISGYNKPEDFAADEWLDMDADRGVVRRQRVYRKLLMSPGMYWEGEIDEDFAYLRNQRNMISDELSKLLDCELQLHRHSAFLIMGSEGGLGRCFPEENTLSDVVLLVDQLIIWQIKTGQLALAADENIHLTEQQFRALIEDCKRRYGKGMVKSYRDMTNGQFYEAIKEYMLQLDMIELTREGFLIRSIVGKIAGYYPEEFEQKEWGEGDV